MKQLSIKVILIVYLTILASVSVYAINPVKSGYKGMLDLGKTFHLDEGGLNTWELSTTHGYQINHYLFVGAGLGFNFSGEDSDITYMPLYFNVRGNLTKTKIIPFIDLKAGYSVIDAKGAFINPNIGASYSFNNRFGAYLKVGYTYQKMKNTYFYYGGYYSKDYDNIGGITARIGFEF